MYVLSAIFRQLGGYPDVVHVHIIYHVNIVPSCITLMFAKCAQVRWTYFIFYSYGLQIICLDSFKTFACKVTVNASYCTKITQKCLHELFFSFGLSDLVQKFADFTYRFYPDNFCFSVISVCPSMC